MRQAARYLLPYRIPLAPGGKLPWSVKAEQLPGGTIMIYPSGEARPVINHVALHARVSSSDQRGDLDAQLLRQQQHAGEQGWVVVKAVMEVGSV